MTFKVKTGKDRKGMAKPCLIAQIVYMPEEFLPSSPVSFDPLKKVSLSRPYIKIITFFKLQGPKASYRDGNIAFYIEDDNITTAIL